MHTTQIAVVIVIAIGIALTIMHISGTWKEARKEALWESQKIELAKIGIYTNR